MKSAKAGAVLLSIWSGLNLLLAVGILIAVIVLHRNPPSLSMVFSDAEISRLDVKAIGLIRALAVLFNACAAAFCLLVLWVVWKGLVRGNRWAFWALATSMVLLQAFGFVGDTYLGNHNVLPNAISSVVLVAGLTIAAL